MGPSSNLGYFATSYIRKESELTIVNAYIACGSTCLVTVLHNSNMELEEFLNGLENRFQLDHKIEHCHIYEYFRTILVQDQTFISFELASVLS